MILNNISKYYFIYILIRFPMKYDLIIANPPWIWASKYRINDPLENTTSDPEGKMLKSVF